MADDWEQIADQVEPQVIVKPNINKWDGEDEEEEVKESWEEEEEEKKDEEKIEVKVVKKPKKSLQEKIAEKERLLQEELERKQRELEEEEDALSPEEKLAEKLRIQKLQEESDLKTALETFGIVDKSTGLDSINPTNKAEFTEFAEAISKKVSQFKNKEEFPVFIEELVRSLCANLSSTDIRKTKTTLDTLCLEKQKLEKEKTKKGKSKAKAKLRLEGDNAIKANMEGYADYDYDDFM